MKKLFYIVALGILGLLGFTRASMDSANLTPASQSAISGSLVTFTVTGTNTTGDIFLKYVLPQSATYNIAYQNANLVPENNSLLSLGIEHDPVFKILANSNFSVTITAKAITTTRTLPTITTVVLFSSGGAFYTMFTSGLNAQITPIADLAITNILTGSNPSFSGDIVSYYITLQNIGSTIATGITFVSNFPIPTLFTPTATFNGISTPYNYINYPQDFTRTGVSNLNEGQTTTILLKAPITQNFAVGTAFSQIAKTTAVSPEYTTGNNSATATGIVQASADVRITKIMSPFTGFNAGDKIIYTLTYGNSGGKDASNVTITDLVPTGITIPVSTFSIGTLPAGSGGTIILTGTMNSLLTSGYLLVNTANISTTSLESSTGNNSSIVTGIVPGVANVMIDIAANNLTRPQYNNAPYASGSNIMIQAVSGDTVQLTITYGNFGNTTGSNASIGISGTQGFITLGAYNSNIGTLPLNITGTLVVTGIVGPQNYISFVPTARLSYNSDQLITDSIIIQEPLVCGDGLITRNEPCDTLGNLGVVYSGQVCENQQGVCVLHTTTIINNACINYQYTNTLGVTITGQACSAVNLPLTNPTCSAMTGSAPSTNGTGYTVNLTCKGNNTSTTTPISIDCGNGTSISGIGASYNGTCSYASSFVGNAQCKVGSDVTNAACRVPVSMVGGQCQSLDALDGTIAIVDNSNDAQSRFRCSTINGATAQNITINCGNGTQHTLNNVSTLDATCDYSNVSVPQTYNVQCLVDNVSAPACQKNLIIDEGVLGYCGNGIREGYEQCDDGNLNGTSSSDCTQGCDLKGNGGNMVGCFNVGNTNISIQKGEILPFRWTLDQKKNIVPGSSCDGQADGKIPADSIYCTFDIYNGNNTEADGTPVYSIRKKCNEDNRGSLPVFQYFLNKQNIWRSLNNAFGKYAIDSDSFVSDTYGEYKVSLDKVEYQYCRSDNQNEGTEIDRVCSVDFTVTQPYLAQKSSFGITPKSTSIKLDGYKDIKGDDLIQSTDLNDIMVLDESAYNGNNKTQTMINSFITKYDKLAVAVPESSLKDTAFAGMGITVKIVPQQKIYILQSDTKKTITLKDINKFTAPFTIVTKNIDVVIKGDVGYNGMFLVKDGTITFEKSDEIVDGDRCPKIQTVKGIFVTDQGFLGGEALDNTNTNKQRCTYGGLYVKGILIGNNIDAIVQARRSQLNQWFMVPGTDASAKAARRNQIFNGASVLIEYSPSLRSTLPPGASEFTKALDIYKQ